MLRMTFIRLPAALLALALLGGSAAAQESTAPVPAEGFALDRFNPSERGSEWFALDSLDLRGHGRAAVGVVGDWARRPLVLYDAEGVARGALVRDQAHLHVGAAVVLWDRLRLGVSAPIAAYQAGEDVTLGGFAFTAPDHAAVGDLRLSGDLRLLGAYGEAFTAAAGVSLFVPSGSREHFSGDGALRFLPRLSIAGDLAPFAYAGQVALHYRAEDGGFGGWATGSEVTWGASAGVRLLDSKLVLGPEIYGSALLDGGALETPKAPVELLVGGHYTAGDLRFGVGAGPGLSRGLGEPQLRVVASVEWTPGVKREPGVRTKDPRANSRPEAAGGDQDQDGIPDAVDMCPKVPGPAREDPRKNGCPLAWIGDMRIEILDQVKFRVDSAEILPTKDSAEVLSAVAAILKEHPELRRIRIEAHTDSTASDLYNIGLSKRRAASVVAWLRGIGIEAERLTSVGLGESQPMATNETPEGRYQNRRVEFHIERVKHGAKGAESASR